MPDDKRARGETIDAVPLLQLGGVDRATIVILAGSNVGQIYRLTPGQQITFGRSEDADVQLMDDGASRRHASAQMRGRQVLLRDMGSRNGTFVNGESIKERLLEEGDKIQIGLSTTMKFTLTDEIEEQYQQRMVQAAIRDPLTNLYNRGHLQERLGIEISAARRYAAPLSLIMLDVDHFKAINDQYGHLAGDEVLKALGKTAAALMRHEDLLARYGGEELAVLSRHTALAGAAQLAERLRKAIEQMNCIYEGTRMPVTASMGVAQLGLQQSSQQLIDAADTALYQAKQQGRNRIVVALKPKG